MRAGRKRARPPGLQAAARGVWVQPVGCGRPGRSGPLDPVGSNGHDRAQEMAAPAHNEQGRAARTQRRDPWGHMDALGSGAGGGQRPSPAWCPAAPLPPVPPPARGGSARGASAGPHAGSELPGHRTVRAWPGSAPQRWESNSRSRPELARLGHAPGDICNACPETAPDQPQAGDAPGTLIPVMRRGPLRRRPNKDRTGQATPKNKPETPAAGGVGAEDVTDNDHAPGWSAATAGCSLAACDACGLPACGNLACGNLACGKSFALIVPLRLTPLPNRSCCTELAAFPAARDGVARGKKIPSAAQGITHRPYDAMPGGGWGGREG